MRLISIGDNTGKNAMVGISAYFKKRKKVEEEKEYDSKRIVKTTINTHFDRLLKNTGNDETKLYDQLLKEDPEIDLKAEGKFVEGLHYTYISKENELASGISFEEQIFDSKGLLLEERNYNPNEANIQNDNFPIRWSGITIPLKEAGRRYIFSHTYQLFHVNGLTFSFLYSMAKELEEKQVAMFVGGGLDGREPIVLTKGGKKYRGFMTGQTKASTGYKLLLHLTEIDLEDYR